MKRTLLLASIAFIPTLALAQPPALPDRALVIAQRATSDDKADDQDQRKQNRTEQQQKRRDDRKQAQENRREKQQQRREDRQAQQQKRDDRQDARQERREQKQDARQEKREERREDKREAQQDRRKKQQDAQQQKREDAQQKAQDARQERRDDRKDAQRERRDDKRDAKQERREDKQDARQERREDKQDARQDRREDRKEAREDRRLDAIRAERKETREGNRTVIRERDRTIIRENNRTIIRHDDTERFRRAGGNVQVVRRGDRTERVIVRPGGVRVTSVYNARGQLIRRTRVVNGREYVLFTNTPAVGFGFIINVPPPVIHIPRERYIVDYRSAPRPWIYETLVAPPVMPVERRFTLDQVRYNYDVRARMPRIDINTITFDFGSWDIRPDQAVKLEPLAEAMSRAIDKNPDEVFLIEGHTDAVGTEEDNLSLSDRRAQAVAEVLTEQFRVPPENMIPQGYGEQNLKVDTQEADERNRYVSVRRVTPLLAQQESSGQGSQQ